MRKKQLVKEWLDGDISYDWLLYFNLITLGAYNRIHRRAYTKGDYRLLVNYHERQILLCQQTVFIVFNNFTVGTLIAVMRTFDPERADELLAIVKERAKAYAS